MNNLAATNLKVFLRALKRSLISLLPYRQSRNPIMFIAYAGAVFSLIATFYSYSALHIQITFLLWTTLWTGNLACAIAENRGKMQAEVMRKAGFEAIANKLVNGKEISVPADQLKVNDLVVCRAGDFIPADGEIVEGIATVNESAITGESAPVIRESGEDRSAVTESTQVMSDKIVIRVTSKKGDSFLNRISSLIEEATYEKTPNEEALNIILLAISIVIIFTVVSVKIFADFSIASTSSGQLAILSLPVLIALLVSLIPTTISSLSTAIGISGMNRLFQNNVIAKSSQSIETAGSIDLLMLDKTGTITFGNRAAVEFFPLPGINLTHLAEVAHLASLHDETSEGRSICALVKNKFDLAVPTLDPANVNVVPFSSHTRLSGIDIKNNDVIRRIRKGSDDRVRAFVEQQGGVVPWEELSTIVKFIATKGGTPIVIADDNQILGVVYLKDAIKGGIKERFTELRKMGIKTLMITGDNPLTAAAIAADVGVDDYIAQATPEMKLDRIRKEQQDGHFIAMAGDGVNDAPALAQADVGIAMNIGTQASRDAGNMIDLDSNPVRLLTIVRVGKQMLMTRGALTTFSFANDIAKYFAIIPAIYGTLYPLNDGPGPLAMLNVMHLTSPESAILSTLAYNSLIIVCLIPIALRGIPYRAQPASKLLQNNLLVYGLGGLVAPFIGIKLIDMLISL